MRARPIKLFFKSSISNFKGGPEVTPNLFGVGRDGIHAGRTFSKEPSGSNRNDKKKRARTGALFI